MQSTIPNYSVPQWLKRGFVLIYNSQISGQQSVPAQQVLMQISGNVVFLVEDVGQYSFVFRMFQVINNPPTLSTSVSGGSGTMSTFHVNPRCLQNLARGTNPNMTVQGNTIIVKGQGMEQRITVDPGTGIMMNMSVTSQGNVIYSLNYAGYTYTSQFGSMEVKLVR